jgi:tetratricopeptide (TPR) repeat protein
MADVFLSYARTSATKAKRVADVLRQRGFSVWFDEHLPAHRAYSDVIEEQLESARAVLVLWSTDAVQSQWVRSEANRARETERLVQVRVDDARLPMPFDQIQCADLRGWSGDPSSPPWQSVVSSVAELTTGETPHEPGSPLESTAGASRRKFVALAGSAVVVTVGGIAGWRLLSSRPSLSPEAQLYLQKGMDELQTNDAFELNNSASLDQAITLLTEATKLGPESAVAWGALAMAYASRKKVAPLAERAGLDARSRSAAKQALALDPREGRAVGALRMLDPVYRHWIEAERADREALKAQPRMPLLLFLLSDVLASVGRWTDAADLAQKFDRSQFLIAGAERKVVVSLWSAGDFQRADDAMRIAVGHWPRNPYVWRTHLAYLTYSGRASEARALLRDPNRPPEISSDYVSAASATVDAVAGQEKAADAIERNLAYLKGEAAAVFMVAHACAALGAADPLFAILNGYYFGQGDWRSTAPPAGDEDRVTAPLFMPPMRKMWRETRFDQLVTRVGLTDYWRQSGTTPDYRRSA